MKKYKYVSTGSDELCNGMAGTYDYEPPRPHGNCHCTIAMVDSDDNKNDHRDGESNDEDCFSITTSPPSEPSREEGYDSAYNMDYQIDCYDHNGNVVNGTSGTKSFSYNSEPGGDAVAEFYAWKQDMLDEIRQEAEDLCDDCNPPEEQPPRVS
ncbi:hypothetical protein [Aquimarina intermedia]|uniref:Uncharacterized protein n=1 Tax=Aquimarina intermedia TaxID=350814 RepID=A0A5S5C6E8_9FLAO|nr:hypothetical protein [Aquimarina intermedia]TYP75001.1 hypothetical protein BD809_10363 [Aquimarina intermedia]